MPTRLAFDIETQANLDRIAELPPPEVALGNLKDPEKIAAKEEEARRKQIDQLALDPHFGRVICISIAMRSADTKTIHSATQIRIDAGRVNHDSEVRRDKDEAERELLSWFWDCAHDNRYYATFNGAQFDVPYLYRRSLILGVRPVPIETNKYRVMQKGCEHYDVMQVLNEAYGCHAVCSRNLRFYTKELLKRDCDYGADLDKGELGRLFDAGQFDLIRQVCSWDCERTLELAELVESLYP